MRKLLFLGPWRKPEASLAQGFDVCITLRKGDKIVRRNERGEIEIVRVTTDAARIDAAGTPRRSA